MVRTIQNIKTVNNQGGLQWKGRTGSWEDSVQLRLVLTGGRIRWSPRAYLLASAATGHRQLWSVCGCTLPVSGVIRCRLLVNHWYQCQNDCTVCVYVCCSFFFFCQWLNEFILQSPMCAIWWYERTRYCRLCSSRSKFFVLNVVYTLDLRKKAYCSRTTAEKIGGKCYFNRGSCSQNSSHRKSTVSKLFLNFLHFKIFEAQFFYYIEQKMKNSCPATRADFRRRKKKVDVILRFQIFMNHS